MECDKWTVQRDKEPVVCEYGTVECEKWNFIVVMGQWNVNRGPWNVNRGPWNVNKGPTI